MKGSTRIKNTNQGKTHYYIITASALLIRLLHLIRIRQFPVLDVPLLDSRAYDELARQIAFHGGMPREVSFQAPLYPYLLSIFYRVSTNPDYIRLFQILVDTFSVFLVVLLTHKMFDRRSSIFSGILSALYPVTIFHSSLLLKSSLTVFFNIALVTVLYVGFKRKNLQFLTTGFVAGIASALHGSFLLFMPVIVLYILLDTDYRTIRFRIPAGLLCILGFFVAVSPFTIRNYMVSGEIVLLTSQGGANFYLGNSEFSDGTSKRPPNVRMTPEHEQADFHREAERLTGRKLTLSESSSFWFNSAMEWITQNPVDAAKLQFRKFALFWNRVEIPDNYDFDYYRRFSPFIRFPKYPFGLLGAFGLAGFILSLRSFRKLWLLHIWNLHFCLIVVAFHVYSRYRLPVVVTLAPFAGYALSRAFDLHARRKYLRLLALTIFIGLIMQFQSLDITSYSHAQPKFNLAAAYAELGENEKAKSMYKEALDIDPDYVPALVNLGKHAYRERDLQGAKRYWLRALSVSTSYPELHNNLAALALESGDPKSAEFHFRKSVEINPYYALGWIHLGQLYLLQSAPEKARSAFQRALDLEPANPSALYGMAQASESLELSDERKWWQNYLEAAKSMESESRYLQKANERLRVLERELE